MKNASEIHYDFMNLWIAKLYRPIDVDTDINVALKGMVDAANYSIKELVTKFPQAQMPSKQAEYHSGKKHMRYPEIHFSLVQDQMRIPLVCKIRMNPCIASQGEGGNHTKIWVIFFNSESFKLTAKGIIVLARELRCFVNQIFDHLRDHLGPHLGKMKKLDSKYDLAMITASIHPDNVIASEVTQFYEKKKISEMRKQVVRSAYASTLLSDIIKINAEKETENPEEYLIMEEGKTAWKMINARFYDELIRINSTQAHTSIAAIAHIKTTKDRLDLLYREPWLKALDFSTRL